MEFQEILELARKKQLKHDRVVEKLQKLSKLQLKERYEKYAESKRFSEKLHKLKRLDSKLLKNSASNAVPKHSDDPGLTSKVTVPSLKNPLPKKATSVVNDAPEKSGVRNTNSISETPNIKKPLNAKPSFADMLELAKKNVETHATHRKPYDDLIPCSVSSKYRELDKSKQPEPLAQKRLLAENSDQQETNNKARVHQVLQNEMIPKTTKSLTRNVKPTLLSESKPPNEHVKRPPLNNEQCKSAIAKQLLRSPLKSTPVRQSHCKPTVQSSTTKSIVKSTPLNSSIQISSESSKHVRLNKEIRSVNVPADKCSPSKTDLSSRTTTVGRGIAAQLGILPQPKSKAIYDSPQEEDYESDDSFIDDSEVIESNEYARVVRDVHRALRFDPRKYNDVNPWEDLRSMEANFRDIEKEEKRSARIAAQEDAAELERDLERKKRKRHQKSHGI